MSESRQRSNQRRLAGVLGFADPACCTIPITGCSPCAADCTGRLTVGMMRDFSDGEARAAAPRHTCGTSGVRHSVRRAWVGHVAWARWRTLRAELAKNAAGPLSFTGPLFDRPVPPTSKCEHRANPVLQKNNAEPRQKTKASPHSHLSAPDHHSVIDLRGIQSVLRECDCIPVVQQSVPAEVVRK
jgi:hypothetical protein